MFILFNMRSGDFWFDKNCPINNILRTNVNEILITFDVKRSLEMSSHQTE